VYAHVTLLSPFADEAELTPGLVGELRDFFADVVPFPFSLREVCAFPGGTVYLPPEPAAPFRALTHSLFQRFPEYPPYGGEFDDVVPHLSVPLPEGESEDSVRFELGPRLPVSSYAREAVLWAYAPEAIRPLETFAFGTTAA
jgi:hypothetical protein